MCVQFLAQIDLRRFVLDNLVHVAGERFETTEKSVFHARLGSLPTYEWLQAVVAHLSHPSLTSISGLGLFVSKIAQE
jgi:hypothetical protein